MCKSTRKESKDARSLFSAVIRMSLVTQIPGRLQLRLDLVLCASQALWKAADAICPVPDVVQLLLRNSASAASHACGVAGDVDILEPTRGSEIQPGEGTRFAKHVTITR